MIAKMKEPNKIDALLAACAHRTGAYADGYRAGLADADPAW